MKNLLLNVFNSTALPLNDCTDAISYVVDGDFNIIIEDTLNSFPIALIRWCQ